MLKIKQAVTRNEKNKSKEKEAWQKSTVVIYRI